FRSKVGRLLVDHLVEAGAEVVVTDVSEAAIDRVRAAHPSVRVVADTAELVSCDLDVYAPCALGGALDDATVAALRAEIVCGSANNQLAHSGVEKLLDERGILYAPDYLVNSGGLIQVSDELHGFNYERARRKVSGLFDMTKKVFALAEEEGVPPATAADRLAERRMAEVSRLRMIRRAGIGPRRRGGAFDAEGACPARHAPSNVSRSGRPPDRGGHRGPASVVPLVLADDLRLRVVLHCALFPAYFLPRLDVRDDPGVGHGEAR